MKVAALWIVKNEEKNIKRTIESVKNAADEILVVDTGSTDDTVAIAESLGARVEHFTWVDDFAAARNYAMEQTNADVIFFLDADEWFDPALTKKDKQLLESTFSNKSLMSARIPRTNIDPEKGTRIGQDAMNRVMRGKGALKYVGIIHEFTQTTGNRRNVGTVFSEWNLMHDGYSKENSPVKVARNKELLEKAVEDLPAGMMKALYTYYLMRECRTMGENDAAFHYLKWLLENAMPLKEMLKLFHGNGRSFSVDSIVLAARYRSQVSRKQIQRVVVDNVKEIYDYHPLSKLIQLYFDLYYSDRDGALLSRLDAAMEKAEAQRGDEITEMDEYFRCYVEINTMAAEAAWRQGDRERAFDCITKALRQTAQGGVRNITVTLLLRTVKGLPITDITLFINSVLDISKRGVVETLIFSLQHEGYNNLYAYYMKKALDAGFAKKSDFWYLMILLERAEEACEMALAEKESTEEDVVPRTLFLAAACTQSLELYDRYKEEMGKYKEALDLMFLNESEGEVNYGIVMGNYQLIAFAGGRDAANRLADVYGGFERESFLLKATYYMNSGLYAEFLEDVTYQPEDGDLACRLWIAECEMMCGRNEQALILLQMICTEAGVDDTYFNLCEALCQRGSPEVAAQARALLEAYLPMYEEWVDLKDVVNTRLLFDADSKKRRQQLVQMTLEEFEGMIEESEVEPFKGQTAMLVKAANVYMENKCYNASVNCLVRALSLGEENPVVFAFLGEVFEALENEPLAEYMKNETAARVEAEKEQ